MDEARLKRAQEGFADPALHRMVSHLKAIMRDAEESGLLNGEQAIAALMGVALRLMEERNGRGAALEMLQGLPEALEWSKKLKPPPTVSSH